MEQEKNFQLFLFRFYFFISDEKQITDFESEDAQSRHNLGEHAQSATSILYELTLCFTCKNFFFYNFLPLFFPAALSL